MIIFYAAYTIMEYMSTFDEIRFDEVRGHHLDNIILGYIEYYNIIHIVQCFVRTVLRLYLLAFQQDVIAQHRSK